MPVCSRFLKVLLLAVAIVVPTARGGTAQQVVTGHHGHAGHDTHGHSTEPTASTPYAGMERRAIKALSTGQIDDLMNGRGMGLALAAELNGYPGPLHVLELADRLALTVEQQALAQNLMALMKAETIALGERIISAERQLDTLFANGHADVDALDRLTAQIGLLGGQLRAAHLRYHISTHAALSAEQREAYASLRGYR